MDCFPELQILICEFSQISLNPKRKSQKWDFLFYCPLHVWLNARYENTASPYRHFERKREIFFIRDRSGKVRTADNGKHRTLCDVGSRCFMQTALRRKRETGNEKDPSAALGMTIRGKAYLIFFLTDSVSEPPSLRGTSFQRKEGDTRMPLSPYRHFERKREIFFVCDRSRHGRTADNGKHRTPCDVGSRCFMQTALRRERETGNEKDPSAALGMTIRGKAYLTFFFN